MALIDRAEFLKQQQEKQERRAAFEANQNGPRVGYFGLADDGDEAVVRFCYKTPEEFQILTTHRVTIDGKFRRVNCLRNLHDPIEKCPMCASGNQVQQRFYIRLIEYSRDENGQVVATPKVWERPTTYDRLLSNLFTEYGPLEDSVFKIKRSGAKGDMKTEYNIMYCNPSIYNESIYPKQNDAFANYSVVGHAVLDKNFDELTEMAGGTIAEKEDDVPFVASTQATAPRKVTY